MDNGTPLTITRISAVDLYCFEEIDINLGDAKLLLLKGDNNVGKTSVLRLISFVLQGASIPRNVIRDGSSKGSGSIHLSNGYTLRRSATATGDTGRSYFKVYDEREHEVPGPQEFVNAWLGELPDFNLLSWMALAASDKSTDRQRAIQTLLSAIDPRITREEFTAATGYDAPASIDFGRHALEVIEDLRTHYADQRRLNGRDADQKKKAAAELRAGLPSERPVITDAQRAEAEAAAGAAKSLRASLEQRILAASSYEAATRANDEAQRREHDEIARLESEVARAEQEIARLQGVIVKFRAQQQSSAERITQLGVEREGLATSAPPSEAEKAAANETIRAANESSRVIAAAEAIIAKFREVESKEAEAADLAVQASILDAAVKAIDTDLRSTLMAKAKLPVQSLAVSGDRIIVDGHPFDQLAESAQIRISVAIARALRPTLQEIVLDGTERLSLRTFNAFLEEIAGDGFRYIATCVDPAGGPLQMVVFGDGSTSGVAQTQKAVA